MDYAALLEKSRLARRSKDTKVLLDLMGCKYRKVAIKCATELYLDGECSIGQVKDLLGAFKYDRILCRIVDFLSTAAAGAGKAQTDLYQVFGDFSIWEDYIVYLEQFSKTLRIRPALLTKVQKIRIFKTATFQLPLMEAASANCDQGRRQIAVYLLGYCEFMINRYPERRLGVAEQTALSHPAIPYPEEHRGLLEFLCENGMVSSLDKLGYDPESHGEAFRDTKIGDDDQGELTLSILNNLLSTGQVIDFADLPPPPSVKHFPNLPDMP